MDCAKEKATWVNKYFVADLIRIVFGFVEINGKVSQSVNK
jgi:hypothetical protein